MTAPPSSPREEELPVGKGQEAQEGEAEEQLDMEMNDREPTREEVTSGNC